MPTHLLLKYGKIRNESKSIAIFDGPFRHQRNAEYIDACKSWGCQGRSCPDSGCVITIFNWKQQGVKWKNIHLILHLLLTILCENKPGYARKQIFTKAYKAPKYQEKLRNARLCNNDKSAICMPRQNPYFCLKRFKIKAFEEWEWDLYPHCTPILLKQ